MPSPKEPLCWWCDESPRCAPLVVRHGTWFHRGACVKAFESAGGAPTQRLGGAVGRRAGEEQAPLRRNTRIGQLLASVRGRIEQR